MRRGAILFSCVLALSGCGGEPAPALTVEIVTARADPEPPRETWRLRGEDGREHPLAPTGARGARGALHEARAPAGRYALAGTPPWGPVGGPSFVALAPGATPPLIAAGRAGTLYLGAPAGRRIEEAALWGLGGSGGAERRLDVVVTPGTDDWVAVRFASAGDGKGTVRIAARFDDGTFAEPARIRLPGDGTPWGAALRAGDTVALDVLLLGHVPPGPFHAAVRHDGMEARLEAPVGAGGRVRFERFPLTSSGASVGFPEGPGVSTPRPLPWDLASEDLARGDARLWGAAAPDVHPALVVDWTPAPPEDLRLGRVQVRREEDDSYGLSNGTSLAPGKYRLLWTGPRTSSVSDVAIDHDGRPRRIGIEVGAVCQVRTTLTGTLPTGRRHSVLARRIEDGRAVLAHGFVARDLSRPEHELTLPPGRYRLAVEVVGREGPSVDLALDAPGSRASVRLAVPR